MFQHEGFEIEAGLVFGCLIIAQDLIGWQLGNAVDKCLPIREYLVHLHRHEEIAVALVGRQVLFGFHPGCSWLVAGKLDHERSCEKKP